MDNNSSHPTLSFPLTTTATDLRPQPSPHAAERFVNLVVIAAYVVALVALLLF